MSSQRGKARPHEEVQTLDTISNLHISGVRQWSLPIERNCAGKLQVRPCLQEPITPLLIDKLQLVQQRLQIVDHRADSQIPRPEAVQPVDHQRQSTALPLPRFVAIR
jgi:hypothetical protein